MAEHIWVPTDDELDVARSSIGFQLAAVTLGGDSSGNAIYDIDEFIDNYSKTVASLYAETRFLRNTLHEMYKDEKDQL